MGFFSFFTKEKKETLDQGLEKTKESFFGKLTRAVAGKSKVDDEVLDNLEEVLVTSDVGVETTLSIIKRIEARVARDKYVTTDELNNILRDEIAQLLTENNTDDTEGFQIPSDKRPYVILVVGVNGVGKTTTIGKLAYQFKEAGLKVVLGAADTFRAAAVEQICIWGERIGVPVVKQKMGSDPASVAYDTLNSAMANGADVVLIDTAGRLHNKKGLMDELSKIKRVMQKLMPEAPHDVMLVLDGSTGQNAFEQAKQFTSATEVTSMAITKLDGSAKGGVPRRFLHGKTYSASSGNVTFANNTYMQADGSFDNVGSYDTSGTQIEEDPQFANPTEGDFHISGPTQVARKTGDPRWLP